jgi:hypothetical protein
MLKIVYKSVHPHEAAIQAYFTTRSSEPHNHCARLYDVLDVPTDEDESILVMPLLRRYNDPPLETWADAIAFFQDIITVSGTHPWTSDFIDPILCAGPCLYALAQCRAQVASLCYRG